MFWFSMLGIALAATFFKLGAASVALSVLGIALLASVIVIAALLGLVAWLKHKARTSVALQE